MSSLADELAADLDFSDDQAENSDDEQQQQEEEEERKNDPMDTEHDQKKSSSPSSPSQQEQTSNSVHNVCHFFQNEQTKKTLEVKQKSNPCLGLLIGTLKTLFLF